MTERDDRKQDSQAQQERQDQAAPAAEESPQEAPEAAQADEIEKLRTERDDYLNRLQRVSADYVNYQKRVQRDVEQARAYANEQLIKDLLDVLDNMERALDAGRESHDDADPLVQGMQLVHDSMLNVLTRAGLSRIPTEGQPFDPEKHSALMRQPTDEHPPMTVVKEVIPGWELKGRPIRPAQVVVAMAPEEDSDEESATES